MRKLISSTCVLALLAGCSTASKDIATTYVSPLQYRAHDCDQLAAESLRITTRMREVGGRLDKAASNDKMITTGGIILFWPALFFLGGTKEQEAEYGRLKGEYDAVQQAAVAKRCMSPQPLEATNPVPAPAKSMDAEAKAG